LLVLLLLMVYVYYPVLISPESGYLDRKGNISEIKISKHWLQNDSFYTELELSSDSGLLVEALIRKPAIYIKKSLPVVVLLGGTGTGRNACGLITSTPSVICVSINYPYHGDKKIKGVGYLYNLHDIQQAIKDTPPAVLLVLDYLLAQSISQAEQVELVGVSFGAYFVSIPTVLDKRVTRVWIVQGAAEPIKVIRHNFLKDLDSDIQKDIVAHLLGWSLGSQHVDPEKWVGRISPRPVIFLNSKHDESLPDTSVAALHRSAGQPSEIIWTGGKHVTPQRQDVIEQLGNIVLKRIESGK